MIPLTFRITLEIDGLPNCHANSVPWIKPRTRTGKLDRKGAVRQINEEFAALLQTELSEMVRELREQQIRVRRARRG